MKILVTGATGFIGKTLLSRLAAKNYSLVVLSRSPEKVRPQLPSGCEVFAWNPSELPPAEAFQGVDAVIHLAGENIGGRRWTSSQKKKIRESRTTATRRLVEAIQKRRGKPLSVISASAIGFYGDRGDETLHESSAAGTGFLAEVCRDWEKEAKALPYGSARLVTIRIGVVVGPGGGALQKMLPPFKMGLGGPIGTGKQWMSWIHRDDLVSLILWALENPAIEGVVNAVSPHPVTNADFSKALGNALNRPATLRTPALALKILLGEMSELVLGSQKVLPDKALSSGFHFRFPTIEKAFTEIFAAPQGKAETDKVPSSSV